MAVSTPWRFSLLTFPLLSSTTLFSTNISISIASNRRLFPPFSRSVRPKSKCTFATPQKYVYPDPIPEFAEAETNKFAKELLKKLSMERETFGNDLNSVVEVCSEIFREFLQEEYGGPGTLMVEPFTNMLIALKDKKLPGAPMAARASLLWAQNHLDQDWEIWNSKPPKLLFTQFEEFV